MSEFEQIGFGSTEFVDNPEPRCPCLLLLDTSHSMQGSPIAALNRGIVAFKDELAADTLAMKRVEIAVVTFGPVNIASDFQTPCSGCFPCRSVCVDALLLKRSILISSLVAELPDR